jgi:hypothetical protein
MLGLYDDNKTALIVNQDSNHPALATLGGVPSSGAGVVEVDPMQGTQVPALDDAPFLPGFQVSLQPGDARLFHFTP